MRKRVTLFAGHYGSGKTTVAVNWALMLRAQGLRTAIVDLDIVNPYFRTRDAAEMLEKADVRLIASPFAGTNVDAPALPAAAYAAVEDHSLYAVLDVGGDDRGALALGRYAPYLLAEDDYEFLCVINQSRPLTRDALSTQEIMREIESACGMRFTGLVNNTNLGDETTKETVLASRAYAQAVSLQTGLPVRMTCAPRHLLPALDGMPGLFPLDKTIKAY